MLIFTAVVCAFILSLILVPGVRALARRRGWICHPRGDRWSKTPVALCGGAAIVASLLAAGALVLPWSRDLIVMAATGGLMALLGLLDDFKGLKPYTKFTGQLLIASLAVYFGQGFFFSNWGVVNVLASLFWVVAVTNAMNLLDNMDGLSAGIGIIAAGFLGAVFAQEGRMELAALSSALGASLVGFLIFNFHPASVFMGDCGSLFIGFTLALLSMRTTSFQSTLGAIWVPALVLSVPLLDMSFVSITRILRGRSIAQGGRDHTSHRLVSLGLSERGTVLSLYALGVVSGATAFWMSRSPGQYKLVLLPAALVGLCLIAVYLFDMSRLSPEDAAGRAGPPSSVTTLVFQLRFKRRILEICLDLIAAAFCYCLAYLLRFDFAVPSPYWERCTQSLPLVLSITLACLYSAGLYNGIWRFTGVRDVPRFFLGAVFCSMFSVAAMALLYRFEDFPRSVFPLYGLLLFLMISLIRYSFKLLGLAVVSMRTLAEQKIPVLIVGAGEGGEMVLREILAQNGHWNWKPVGFVDVDANKKSLRIHGVPILGAWKDMEKIFEWRPFSQVVLSPDELSAELLNHTLSFCRARNIPVKRFRWVCEEVPIA